MKVNAQTNDKQTIDITKEYKVNFDPVEKTAFAEFIRNKRKEFNEEHGKEISTKDLGTMIGIKYEMFRKILNQEKPTKKRDCIIAICVALQLLPGEIDEALGLYQYMPALDKYNPRESFIISQITGKNNITVAELNTLLIQHGFPGLDVQDKRDGKKKIAENPVLLSYKILKLNVRTPLDSDYYGDPYDSLCTKYAPYRYRMTGDMLLSDSKREQNIHLIASTDGHLSAQINGHDILPTSYKTLEETGDYKNYFIDLSGALHLEKQRLLSILNDTKNYQCRSSARLIGDSICVFSEEFNYSLPELNEYYILSYSAGKYELKVYEQSAFMYYYLPENEYKSYYTDIPEVKEVYKSIEQIDTLMESAKQYSDDKALYRMRKRAFQKLQPDVDDLYQKLKERKIFIQNPAYIYDNPADTLRYYKLESDYECTYDEYGEICGSLSEKEYTLPDGTTVTISLDDIFSAFELGFSGIEEICRIKAKYGSIDSVMQ